MPAIDSASRSRRAGLTDTSSSAATSEAVTRPRDWRKRRVATRRSARMGREYGTSWSGGDHFSGEDALESHTRARGAPMEWKLELISVPVSDVDRAKAFYTERVGFVADVDAVVNEELRFVQLTPPGSACSIAIGTGLTSKPAGSVDGLQLVVKDIHEARDALVDGGVE